MEFSCNVVKHARHVGDNIHFRKDASHDVEESSSKRLAAVVVVIVFVAVLE